MACLILAMGAFYAYQDAAEPGREREANAVREHIAAARLLEGDAETRAEALASWELAWESAQLLSPEDREQVLCAMNRLRKETLAAARPDRKKMREWNVLSVVIPQVDVRRMRNDVLRKHKYRVDPRALKALSNGFDRAIERLNRVAPDRVSFEGKFVTARAVLREIGGDAYKPAWVTPEIATGIAPQWKSGKYDIVLVSLVNAMTDGEAIPFGGEMVLRPGVEGVGYANLLWFPEETIDNEKKGEREVQAIFALLRSAVCRGGGYDESLLPRGGHEAEKEDPDYEVPDDADRVSFVLHLLGAHVTPGMWANAKFPAVPSTPFLKEWRLSRNYRPREGVFALDQGLIDEMNAGREVPSWRIIRSRENVVDIRRQFGGQVTDDRVAYAALYLHARKACTVHFWAGGDGAFKVFLNGESLLAQTTGSTLKVDEEMVLLDLNKGANLLMVKVHNKQDKWQLIGRICDDKGKAPAGVVPSLSPR